MHKQQRKKMKLHIKNKMLLSMTHCPYAKLCYMPSLNLKYFLCHSISHTAQPSVFRGILCPSCAMFYICSASTV